MRPTRIMTGSIPACAGETSVCASGQSNPSVYPRVCGGNPRRWSARCRRPGLSPRVWGKPLRIGVGRRRAGSIPACAGETARRIPAPPQAEVYPRVCGGNDVLRSSGRQAKGLSPRVRGKLTGLSEDYQRLGSIPACAGETDRKHRSCRKGQVYPRVCGGNGAGDFRRSGIQGLSPRVRGKRQSPRTE